MNVHDCSYRNDCKYIIDAETNTYTCIDTSQVHICNDICDSKQICNGLILCTISGRCFGQSSANMSNTSMNHPRSIRKKSKNGALIYDPSTTGLLMNCRSKSIRKKRTKYSRSGKSNVDIFDAYQMIRKILGTPLSNTLRDTNTNNNNNINGIQVINLQPDDNFSKYSKMIVLSWSILIKSLAPTCTFRDFLVGFLYKLQYGICFDGVVICTSDEYLNAKLPSVSSLSKIGVPKKSLRIGGNYMMKSLRKVWLSNQQHILRIFKDHTSVPKLNTSSSI